MASRRVNGFIIEADNSTWRLRGGRQPPTQPPKKVTPDPVDEKARGCKYPFGYLKPGESFTVPFDRIDGDCNSVACAARHFVRRHTDHTWVLATRKTARGIRVHRIT